MGVDNKNTIETKAPIIDIKDLGLTQGSGDNAKFEKNKPENLTNNTADEFKKVFENIQNKNNLKLKTITDALSKLTTEDKINLSAEILKSSDPKGVTNEKVINDYKRAVKGYQDIITSLETASKDHFDWNKIGYHLTGKAGEIRKSTVTLLSSKANDIYNNAKIINAHSQKIIDLSTQVIEPVKIETQPAPTPSKLETNAPAPTYLEITNDKTFKSLSKPLTNNNITDVKGLVKKFTNNNKEIYIVPTSKDNSSAIQVFNAKLNMKEVYVSASIDKNDPSKRLVLNADGVKLSDDELKREIDASKKLNETVSLKKKLETKDITTLDQAQGFIKNLTYMLDNTSEGEKIKQTIQDNNEYNNALTVISNKSESEKNINKSQHSRDMNTEQKSALQTIVNIINMNIKIPSSTPQPSNKSEVKKEMNKKTEQKNSNNIISTTENIDTIIDTTKLNSLNSNMEFKTTFITETNTQVKIEKKSTNEIHSIELPTSADSSDKINLKDKSLHGSLKNYILTALKSYNIGMDQSDWELTANNKDGKYSLKMIRINGSQSEDEGRRKSLEDKIKQQEDKIKEQKVAKEKLKNKAQTFINNLLTTVTYKDANNKTYFNTNEIPKVTDIEIGEETYTIYLDKFPDGVDDSMHYNIPKENTQEFTAEMRQIINTLFSNVTKISYRKTDQTHKPYLLLSK